MQATFIENPNLREKILQWIINNIKRRRTYESDRECDRWTILNRCTELNAALFRSANSEGKWSCRVLQNYTSSLYSSYYTTSLRIADIWVPLKSHITKVNTTQWYSNFIKFDLVWLGSTEILSTRSKSWKDPWIWWRHWKRSFWLKPTSLLQTSDVASSWRQKPPIRCFVQQIYVTG